MIMDPMHGLVTFDSSGYLWVVHMTMDASFDKGFSYITKLKVQAEGLSVMMR